MGEPIIIKSGTNPAKDNKSRQGQLTSQNTSMTNTSGAKPFHSPTQRGVSEVVKKARESISLLDYFNEHVAGCKQKIGKLTAFNSASLCPLHDETDASFHLYTKNGVERFHCFGCGKDGDVVDLYKRIEGLYHKRFYNNKDDCATALLKLYGIEIPKPIAEANTEQAILVGNVFEQALQKVRSFKEMPTFDRFNIVAYRRKNDALKKDTHMPMNVKIQSYGVLDLLLASAVVCAGQGV